MRLWILFLLTTTLLASNYDIQFSKSIKNKERLKSLVSEVLRELPKEVSQYKLKLNIKSLNTNFNKDICSTSSENVLGMAKNIFGIKTIIIDSSLVDLAFTQDRKINCYHGSILKLLKATLIHELIHLYDYKHNVSKKKQFKSLVGGKDSSLQEGSVDSYEYLNYKESFAVNYEYFILDKKFQCQKPAYYKFYKKTFKMTPFAKEECSSYKYVLLNESTPETNLTKVKKIDPKRLYQVHYLFAAKGEAMMSRWGHAMYRLVLCSPKRKEVSEKCLEDISHHLVISYRANISDMSISYLMGLLGKYPSQLFIYEMSDILQEYTRKELRDIYSVPLKMTKGEAEQFVNITVQKFWDYRGKYYFTTNNCATESKRHFVAAMESKKKIRSLTPLKMYKTFLKDKNGLVDKEVFDLEDEAKLIRMGLLFKSKKAGLLKALDKVQKYGLLPTMNLKNFKNNSTIERLQTYKDFFQSDAFLELSSRDRLFLLISIRSLERYFLESFEDLVATKVMNIIKSDKRLVEDLSKEVEENPLLAVDQWKIVKNNTYGVPSLKSIKAGLEAVKVERAEINQQDIMSYLPVGNDNIQEEVEAVVEINKLIKRMF